MGGIAILVAIEFQFLGDWTPLSREEKLQS
jgi:hypothetical protein